MPSGVVQILNENSPSFLNYDFKNTDETDNSMALDSANDHRRQPC